MAAWMDQVFGGQRLAGRAHCVDRVGFAAAALRGPFGTACLDDPFAGGVEEGGEPGPVAARSLRRPSTGCPGSARGGRKPAAADIRLTAADRRGFSLLL